jgi:hypothetical protein
MSSLELDPTPIDEKQKIIELSYTPRTPRKSGGRGLDLFSQNSGSQTKNSSSH